MPQPRYDLDISTSRYVRQDAVDPALAGDIVLGPGELADIADGGRLQGILTRARKVAFDLSGPAGEADLIGSLWSLHEEGGVLLIRWRSLAGFHRFASTIEAAWEAVGEQAFIHYVSTETDPICWSDGLEPLRERYLRD